MSITAHLIRLRPRPRLEVMLVQVPSYTNFFADALVAEAKQDKRIIGIHAAMGGGTGMNRFEQQFPERTFDVGIAEQVRPSFLHHCYLASGFKPKMDWNHFRIGVFLYPVVKSQRTDFAWHQIFTVQHAVTFAAGLACEGMIPFCAIYSSFLQRGYDQIIHDVALQSLPVRFAMDRAGMVGADGATHCGFADVAYMGCIPNMVVMAVSCPPRPVMLSPQDAFQSAAVYNSCSVVCLFRMQAVSGWCVKEWRLTFTDVYYSSSLRSPMQTARTLIYKSCISRMGLSTKMSESIMHRMTQCHS